MEKFNPEEPLHLHGKVEAVHHMGDETIFEIGTYSNMNPEQQRELLADTLGLPPENIVDASDTSTPRGKLMVGFRKWRSSWDPHAQKIDPNLN